MDNLQSKPKAQSIINNVAEVVYPFPLAKLDENPMGNVFSFLSTPDTSTFAQSTKVTAGFFQSHVALERKAPLLRPKLFHWFAYGQRRKWQALLDEHIHDPKLLKKLLCEEAAFTDCGNRDFEPTTPFRYALWAKDRFSWEALLPYMKLIDPTGEIIRNQFMEHEKNGLTYTQRTMDEESKTEIGQRVTAEKHYDFNDLIEPLNTYTTNYDALWNIDDFDGMRALWSRGVGPAQERLVAHGRQEYCRPERSFDPQPTFNDKTIQDGASVEVWNHKDQKWEQMDWLADSGVPGFGSLFAFVRTSYRYAMVAKTVWQRAWRDRRLLPVGSFAEDLAAIRHLDETRTLDYKVLRKELFPEAQPAPSSGLSCSRQ